MVLTEFTETNRNPHWSCAGAKVIILNVSVNIILRRYKYFLKMTWKKQRMLSTFVHYTKDESEFSKKLLEKRYCVEAMLFHVILCIFLRRAH